MRLEKRATRTPFPPPDLTRQSPARTAPCPALSTVDARLQHQPQGPAPSTWRPRATGAGRDAQQPDGRVGLDALRARSRSVVRGGSGSRARRPQAGQRPLWRAPAPGNRAGSAGRRFTPRRSARMAARLRHRRRAFGGAKLRRARWPAGPAVLWNGLPPASTSGEICPISEGRRRAGEVAFARPFIAAHHARRDISGLLALSRPGRPRPVAGSR